MTFAALPELEDTSTAVTGMIAVSYEPALHVVTVDFDNFEVTQAPSEIAHVPSAQVTGALAEQTGFSL